MKNPRTQAWLTRPDGLATRLRTARGAQSVRQLGEDLAWPSSKVSRVETGQQVPTELDLERWAAATGTPDSELQEWLDELQEVQSMRSTFRRRLTSSQAEVQGSFAAVEAEAVFLRTLQIAAVPTMLQTADYARELFLLVEDFYQAGRDIDEAVAARMRRQDNLHDQAKRFEFIIGEAVLHYIPGRVEVMHAQMDRLIVATTLRNARFGIIPFQKPLTMLPGPSVFTIYDDDGAYVEGWTEDRQYAGSQVTQLHQAMDRLWQNAVEGDEARALILKAKAALA